MKTLKVKSILFSLLAIMVATVFMTSCEQTATIDTLEDMQNVETAADDLEERGSFSLNNWGDSHIYWPFANSSYINGWTGTNNWRVTCGPDCGWHHGGDYYADDWANYTCGTEVKAPFSGKVIYSGWSDAWGYGNQIVIQSTDNYNFAFRIAHMQNIYYWKKGDYVQAGQLIGHVGTTGNSTGCHGHCVLYKNIYQNYKWGQTGLYRLERGWGLGSAESGGPNKFAAPYYFSAGNKSARTSGKGETTKEPDLDGTPSCGPVADIKESSKEIQSADK